MEEVIVIFVKDYEVDGEWRFWLVCSPYLSKEDIETIVQDAKNNGEIGEDAEYYTEEYPIWYPA